MVSWDIDTPTSLKSSSAMAKLVAEELNTTGRAKWNTSPTLPEGYRPTPNAIGKYRAQQWIEKFHPEWDGHWPDLVYHGKLGLISRPETSKAQGRQSDDRYEAFGIAYWMLKELEERDRYR